MALTGPIPTELFQLSQLTTIWLQENELTGMIPLRLLELTQLDVLELHRNQFEGSIPPEVFGPMLNLQRLDLTGNFLTGTIPTEVGLYGGSFLFLSENKLTGSIPEELFQAPTLTLVELNDNDVSSRAKNSQSAMFGRSYSP